MMRCTVMMTLAILAAGCSTSPIANTLDFFCPGKMYPPAAGFQPYGGVGVPQGAILPPPPGVIIGVPQPPGPSPVPPPMAIPGNVPPGVPGNVPPPIQLQPPPPTPPPFGT